MKKLFALLLALTMTFQLAQPVWAETVATEPTQTTQTPKEPEETVPESTEPETTEPAVPAQTEAPETTAPETTEASVPESEEPQPAADPSAEDVPVPQSDSTGTCGESLTWTLAGGTLTISGSGAMTDYGESNTAPWYSGREQITAVVVDRGVTGIGAYAFYGCVNLIDITLPEGLTAIGQYAFTGCSNLGRVEILSGMTTLGSSAFEESGVTEVVLPEGLKTIEYGAFASCANLRSVSLPSTLENLKSCAFWQCSALTAITLPQSIRNMEYNCFGRCSSLTEIEIPSQLTTIEAYVFDGCTALKSVTMQEGLKVIRDSAFRGCEALSQIHLPESITELGGGAFSGCKNLTTVNLPQGITKIPSNLFSGCGSLTAITIPDSVFTIGYSAFSGCSSLEAVEIPTGVSAIGSYAFSRCTSLTEMVIPEGVSGIADNTFYNCTALKWVDIPVGVSTIGSYAFSGCEALSQIHLPESITELGEYAFSDCKNLTTVNLPQGITKIPKALFLNCSSLEAVEIPTGVSAIESSAFIGCTSLTEMVIPEGVSKIGNRTFYNCTSLRQVTLPGGLTEVGQEAFQNCSALEAIELPEKVTTIGVSTFYGCKMLKQITLPDSLTEIGVQAFQNCSALEAIKLPDKLTSVGKYAFFGCSSLTEMVIPEGVSQIGYETFYNCTSLRQVTLPSSLTEIGQEAFQNCSALEAIELPDKLTSVGNYTFSGCKALERVDIPASVAAIGESAFSGCAKLTAITFGHRQENPLTIGEEAFNVGYYGDNVKTRIGVYSVRGIHPAIQGYAWEKRTVTYYNTETIPLEAIAVHAQDDAAEIEVGLPLTFVAELTPFDTTEDPVWSINPDNSTGTAEITAEGVLTGLTPGIVTVRAAAGSDESVYGETQISLLPPTGEPDSILVRTAVGAVDEAQLGIPVQMQAVFQPGNVADKHVSWSVSNEKIAAIDENGMLTPLALGNVTVYAESDTYGVEGSCVVKVLRYIDSVTILRDGGTERTTLGVGEKLELTTLLTPADTTSDGVTWTVEEITGQAELVTSYGRPVALKGIAPGIVRVTATAKDYAAVSDTVELTVTDTVVPYALTDGSGNIYFDTATGTIVRSDNTVRNVSIPGAINGVDVTAIAPYVFHDAGAETITAVSIPKSLRKIGSNAFSYCGKMVSLRFNRLGELETIGESAFRGCTALTSLAIPACVQTIENFAFSGCSSMESLRFASDSRLQSIGESAFIGCDALSGVSLPEGLKTVGRTAFYDCDKMESLRVPDSVTSIGENAFSYCDSLKSVTISGEMDLKKVLLNDTLDTLTLSGTFVQKAVSARNVKLLDTITEVRDGAFEWQRIEQLILSQNLKTIGAEAFEGTEITSVTLPEGIVSLGKRAFAECSKLTTVNLPDSLQSIGQDCFEGCSNLNILDLSSVPDTFVERETKLDDRGVVPPVLVRATGGKVSGSWWAKSVEGNYDSEVAFVYWSNGSYYLAPESSGRFMLVYRDEYTGAQGMKIAQARSGLVIRPSDVGYLTGGQSLQLSAYMMPENTAAQVTWSLGAGDEAYASLSQTGLLKVSSGVNVTRQITVTALPKNGGDAAVLKLWLVPRTTGLEILRNGESVGSEVNADMASAPSMTLTVRFQPEDAAPDVVWISSDAKVADVDNGVVTFLKPGTAVIKAMATDGSKVSAQVKINVTYVDGAKKLTLTTDAASLQPGQTARLTLKGSGEIPADMVSYTLQNDLGTVENGVFTAGEKPGAVTVTAAIQGDPLKRTASVKLTVTPLLVNKLEMEAHDDRFQMEDQAGETLLIIDKQSAQGCSFPLTLSARDYRDEPMENYSVTYASTDTSIATVTAKGVVTLKPGANGQCAIVATVKDAGKATARLWISVRDYSPRLESSKLTLNTALTDAAVSTGFVESYGNGVTGVSVTNDNRFTAGFAASRLTLRPAAPLPNGRYNLTVEARCADGKTYSYALNLQVKNVLPKVTVKQTARLNLFCAGAETTLTVAAQGAEVENVVLTDNTDFTVDWQDGTALLRLSDSASPKPNTKAKLEIHLAGYAQPVIQNLSISAGTTVPKLKLSTPASSLNTALNPEDLSARVQILEGTSLLDLSNATVWTDSALANVEKDGSDVVLTLREPKAASVNLYIQDASWRQSVKLTHKLTVETKLPTLKPNGAINLNAYFTQITGSTELVLSQKNLTLEYVRFVPAAKAGTPARTESDKLTLTFDPAGNRVTAAAANPDNAPKAGTYSFTCTGVLPGGTEIPGGTLKITVGKALPKLKLSASSVKLNRFLAGQERASVTASLSGFEGCELAGFRELEQGLYSGLSFENGVITASLRDSNNLGGSYKLTPVVRHCATGQLVDLPAAVTLKVAAYNSDKLSMSLSAKGKLDTLDPESAIVYTVTRLTNCQGSLTDLRLEGPDKDLFRAVLDSDSNRIHLTMVPGQTYATNVTYQVRFRLTVCGREILSPVMKFKVTQTALKFAAMPVAPIYQAQTGPLTVRLTLTAPAGAAIGDIRLNEKTSAAFLEAIGGPEGFRADPETLTLRFALPSPGNLRANSTYTVLLDITPKGNAENVKPTQVRLTVKVMK